MEAADAEAADRQNLSKLSAAWDQYADDLKRMGHQLLESAPTAADRSDALRFLLRQVAYREEQFLEFPGDAAPELFFAESPTRKIFADCPDTIYHQFAIRPGGVYRIVGSRGESPYISVTVYRAGVTDRVVGDLHDGELQISDDGSFTITVGGPEQPSNWLPTGDDGAFVIIREYCHDRVGGVKATFDVVRDTPVAQHRQELDADRVSIALAMMGFGLQFSNDATIKLSASLRERPNVMNEAAAELVSEMAGTPHNHYQLCYVKLDEGQALELELHPPPCRYWSVHLNNWWLESPEFRDGQSVCINDAQAEYQPDGTVKVLVGPDNPGSGNWLDTKGRSETVILARYLLPENELPPIVTKVISI